MTVQSFAISGANLFVGTLYGGVFFSSNNGTSWTAVNTGLTNTYVRAFAVSSTNIFAGTDGGVFLSTNNGTSWTAVNTGLTNTQVRALVVSGTNLFVGTSGDGVWRRPLSEMTTGVKDNHKQIPTRFVLEQNYPNPFNPSTVISYQLPVNSYVTLKIFDMLGCEVATLVNEEQSAGWKEVQWNASGFASGIYVYRLTADKYNEIRRMIMMK